jgi:hypothetical protein
MGGAESQRCAQTGLRLADTENSQSQHRAAVVVEEGGKIEEEEEEEGKKKKKNELTGDGLRDGDPKLERCVRALTAN